MPRMELTRMPMEAKASMAPLNQAMMATLGEAMYEWVACYADDLLVYSKTMEEHVKHVDDVLGSLDENSFCISRKKIELGKTEVTWLGYKISAEGIKPDSEKIEQLLGMRKPTSILELKSAIGLWTFFASFVPRYSIIAAPLMAQLKKDNVRLRWTPE